PGAGRGVNACGCFGGCGCIVLVERRAAGVAQLGAVGAVYELHVVLLAVITVGIGWSTPDDMLVNDHRDAGDDAIQDHAGARVERVSARAPGNAPELHHSIGQAVRSRAAPILGREIVTHPYGVYG